MEKEKVLEKLKQINYPGFNRDIVSFGMVKDITVDKDNVKLVLSISSQNEEKKQKVIKSVKERLSNDFTKVDVSLKTEVSATSSPQQQPSPKPILDHVKHVIAIASGKGGVGKSTIATNLACALSKKGGKIGLLDLDIYGPSLPILLGVNEQPKMTEDNKLIPIKKFGMEIMSFGFISGNDTPVIWRGPLVSRMTEQFFRDVAWGDLDILLLDLPPGTGDIHLSTVQAVPITGAVIVSTPQNVALADARKGVAMFRVENINVPVLGLIENMAYFTPPELPENKYYIFGQDGVKNLSNQLQVPFLGELPIVQSIREAGDVGRPAAMQEGSEVQKAFENIARRTVEELLRRNEELPPTEVTRITTMAGCSAV